MNFKCDLDAIKIWTQLGSLKTTKIQVFVKNHKITKVAETNLKDEIGVIFHKENSACKKEIGFFKKDLFYRNSYFAIKNVTEVHICIKETFKCPPVIKKIEILGVPGKANTQDELCEIKRIFKEIRSPTIQSTDPVVEDEEVIQEEETEFVIPEEYLDQITYEIMTLPTVLPSGKVVDQSTIEKHNSYEAQLGRLPYDPFTGQLYSETRKPIFNCSLKAQIDEFMLRNCNQKEIRKAGRSIGKKRKLPDPAEKPRLATDFPNLLNFNSKKMKLSSYSSKQTASLDFLINDALKNMTRFSRPLPKKTDHSLCSECKIQSNLYKIQSCHHLICRKCLLSPLCSSRCAICMIPYSKNNVEKFHHK